MSCETLRPDMTESRTHWSQLWLSNKTSTRRNQQIPSIDEVWDVPTPYWGVDDAGGDFFSAPTVRFPSSLDGLRLIWTLIGIRGLVRKNVSKLGEGHRHTWGTQQELEQGTGGGYDHSTSSTHTEFKMSLKKIFNLKTQKRKQTKPSSLSRSPRTVAVSLRGQWGPLRHRHS